MSSGYLLDTNVLSAAAPDRRAVPDTAKAAARDWIRTHADELWLPVIAVAEIAAGIGAREGAGAVNHAAELSAWLRTLLLSYSARILAYGIADALCAQRLSLASRQRGMQAGFADLAIAGIAVTRNLIVATRNTRHFEPLGVSSIDPFHVQQ